MSKRLGEHKENSFNVGSDGCFLRFRPDGKPMHLNGRQVVAAVIVDPTVIYLIDLEVDPEIVNRRTQDQRPVRRLPSSQLLELLDNAPGSLG